MRRSTTASAWLLTGKRPLGRYHGTVKPPRPTRPWRWLLAPLQWALALVILFEEWGWEPLQRVLVRIGRWPGFRWIEARLRTLSPWGALAVFAVPTVALLPVKLAALWLIGEGHVWMGTLVIIAAKLIGTAVVARLYTLTQPALMQLAWFARLHDRWTNWKDALLVRVRATWPWRAGRVLKRQVRRRWQAWRRA